MPQNLGYQLVCANSKVWLFLAYVLSVCATETSNRESLIFLDVATNH